jgi:predicted dehydrogenase
MNKISYTKANFQKIIRYIFIYGFGRTIVKALGRARPKFRVWLFLNFPRYLRNGKTVGIIGCGQHSFSSIAFFLSTSTQSKIQFALDTNKEASASFALAYNTKDISSSYNSNKERIEVPDLIYISSNHASHTEYAIDFLKRGADVFIEKPISINEQQINMLSKAVNDSKNKVYVGYNRPHSPSIALIKKYKTDQDLPLTLSCFITGHFIPEDHWYRNSAEGTRIVANLGHWIDLSAHMLLWRERIADKLNISISYSNINTPSDNINVNITSPFGDLISLTFTSRSEPFEGVNETINFQQGDLIAKIDDFRTTKIWKNSFFKKFTHWPKNNGHKKTVLQPFNNSKLRNWQEIEFSTRLMLYIESMVISESKEGVFSLNL